MFIYLLIFFLLLIIPFFFPERFRNNICFIILLAFMAIRFDVGWDFNWYHEIAQKKEFSNFSLFITRNDIQHFMSANFDVSLWNYQRIEILNKILYKISWFLNEPQIIILLYSFGGLYFIKKGIEKAELSKDVSFIWIFFYTFPLFFFKYVSIMRQSVALSIIFFSYKYIKEQKIFKFFFCIIFATLFHSSAKYAIILYIFNYIKLTKKKMGILFILSFFSQAAIIFCIEKISLFGEYRKFVMGIFQGGGEKIYYLIILLAIFIIIFSEKITKGNYEKKKLLNIVFSGCCIYILFNGLGHFNFRSALYFLIFILYLIPSFLSMFKHKILFKICFIFSLFLLLNTYLYFDSSNPVGSEFVPYKIFLFVND